MDFQTWNEKLDHVASNETATILWIQRSNSIHYWKVNLYVRLSTAENFFYCFCIANRNNLEFLNSFQFLKKEFFA